MMTRSRYLSLLLLLTCTALTGPAVAEETGEAAEPLGLEAAEPEPVVDPGVGEDGSPYFDERAAQAGWKLGKIEPAVEAAAAAADEIDVILYLRPPSQGADPIAVRDAHMPAIDALARQVREIHQAYRPAWSLEEDEERTVAALQNTAMSAEDRARKRELNLEIDRRLDAMRAAVRRANEARVRPSQQQMASFVEGLGGRVNETILPVNALGVRIPSAVLLQIAEHPLVEIVAPNPPVEYELNVSVPSVGYDTWHSAGLDGGLFDTGLVDSGVQQNSPSISGVLFYTDSGTFNDIIGHGTHVTGIMRSTNATNLGTAWGADAHMWGRSGSQATTMSRMDTITTTLTQSPEVVNHSLGYGRANTTDYSTNDRFYDAFVQNFNVQVTKSAGNSGWGTTTITFPAPAYNIIVVANMDDQNTTLRTDDVRRTSSSVGPTLNGRKKPDITAPGTNIFSTNAFWWATTNQGTCSDTGAVCSSNAGCTFPATCDFSCGGTSPGTNFANCSGTSMAAPHVAGAVVLMEDGGNNNPEAQKAVLLNTADWWTSAGTSGTGDDGLVTARAGYSVDNWDPSYGWGYIDMDEAHFNRGDYFTASLVPRNDDNNEDDYKLYVGQMFANEKATMTWIKRGVYVTGVPPLTVYGLSDLNIRLYNEVSGAIEDIDTDVDDNVHQVEASTSAIHVIKPYSWSTGFSGATTETIALAVEENFELADFPTTFQGIVSRPSVVQPTQQFNISFWIRNDSRLSSHSNALQLNLPAGMILISGANPQSVGTAAGCSPLPCNGGITGIASWTVQAPASPDGLYAFTVSHTHSSYDESYGPANWGFSTTVETDNTPPTPNPMFWNTAPFELNTSQIQMVATTASDPHGPVEYYHDYTGSPSGGTGGSDSGWIASTNFTDSGLQVNEEYCYRIWARDNALTGSNNTTPSAASCDYTDIETPTGITFGTITNNSVQVRSTNTPTNLALGFSGLQLQNVTVGDNSGWQQNNNFWTSLGLSVNNPYSFRAYARNGDGSTTPFSPTSVRYTLANAPGAVAPFVLSDTAIRVQWSANGNPAGTEYFAENLTNGTNSGWITSTFWDSAGLICGDTYSFRVRGRNGDLVQTALVNLGSLAAGPNFDGDAFPDCIDPDDDNDGIVDADDCSPFDVVVWNRPSESQNLRLTHVPGLTTLDWDAPSAPGTSGFVFYDTAVTKFPSLWGSGSAACIEWDDGDKTAVHSVDPVSGQVYFYLNRPQNRCGNGDEGAGEDVPGGVPIPRNMLDCGCPHAMCDTGGPLVATCDPCVASICAVDSFCCSTAWDAICVGEVTSVCGDTCP